MQGSDDEEVLACASAADADFLVTGDADLLVIGRWEEIEILSPRDFEMKFW